VRDILKEQEAKDDSNGDATKGGNDMEGVAQDTWKLVRARFVLVAKHGMFNV
jgi:hypothetical protein